MTFTWSLKTVTAHQLLRYPDRTVHMLLWKKENNHRNFFLHSWMPDNVNKQTGVYSASRQDWDQRCSFGILTVAFALDSSQAAARSRICQCRLCRRGANNNDTAWKLYIVHFYCKEIVSQFLENSLFISENSMILTHPFILFNLKLRDNFKLVLDTNMLPVAPLTVLLDLIFRANTATFLSPSVSLHPDTEGLAA